MEEEIDLRKYVLVLARYWMWIIGAGLIAAVVALAVSFLVPSTYEATALVAVTKPRYIMQFDPRVRTVDTVQASFRAYPELAVSDEMLQILLTQLASDASGTEETLAGLRGQVTAELGSDPSLVRLSVRASDPVRASRIVNTWAELFVDRANQIYGAQGDEQLHFFESQLSQANSELGAVQQQLITFQARNRSAIIMNQLDSYNLAQADYLTEARNIHLILQDIRGLREQLAEQSGNGRISQADQLTALFLQMKAFNVLEAAPLQVQLAGEGSLTQATVGEQIAFLNELTTVLTTKLGEIEALLVELEPSMLAGQQQLQEMAAEEQRLTQARDLIQETSLTLSRKVEEARISAEDASGEVQLASRAAVPERPVSPRKGLNTAVAGFLGMFIGAAVVFTLAWWRDNELLPASPIEHQREPIASHSPAVKEERRHAS